MKNLLTAFILGIALAGAALAQTSTPRNTRASELKLAVIEFSPGANASGMKDDAKRLLQSGLAHMLYRTDQFKVVDVRHTRNASQDNLAALNNGASTAAAVKLGKQLGVSYVLTGTVLEYTPQDADSFGRVVLKTRLIEVATGKVVHTGETTARSTGVIRTTGSAEMHSKTVKPAIDKLTATLAGLKL